MKARRLSGLGFESRSRIVILGASVLGCKACVYLRVWAVSLGTA